MVPKLTRMTNIERNENPEISTYNVHYRRAFIVIITLVITFVLFAMIRGYIITLLLAAIFSALAQPPQRNYDRYQSWHSSGGYSRGGYSRGSMGGRSGGFRR